MLRPTALLALLLVLGTGAASAQTGAEAYAAWVEGQLAALNAAGAVSYTEDATRRVEGPRRREIVLRTRTRYRVPADGRPSRELLQATLDGRTLSAEEYQRIRERMRRGMGRGANAGLGRSPLGELRRLGALTVGPAEATALDGVPVWEIPLQDPEEARPVATVWLSREGAPQLLRSRYTRRGRRGRTEVVTAYARRAGLDLPARREATAEIRQRRRIRTFTTIVEIEARFEDVRVEPR